MMKTLYFFFDMIAVSLVTTWGVGGQNPFCRQRCDECLAAVACGCGAPLFVFGTLSPVLVCVCVCVCTVRDGVGVVGGL